MTTYNAASLDARLDAAQDYFNAAKTFSQNAQTAYNDYVLADFEAAKQQALAYLTASITELTDNYAKEAELAQTRADAYSDLLDAQLANLAATDLSYFAVISSLKDAFAEASATALANDATIAVTNATQLTTEQTENEAEYNDATDSADATYQKAWQDAWNDAFLETLGETANEKTDVDAITAAMQAALETANATYRAAAFAAYEDFSDETLDLAKIYAYNQERIDQGGTVPGNAFENPTFDYEVCFVAGTQVLTADGSTKPIEQIRPGDQVLAADHLNPEEKPTAAKVVRFFDNGEKNVVKLSFENYQEIVCTPGHRFYVLGKNWVHAQDLQQGDLCLSATGEKIAFLSKENLSEKLRVYNFEVEEKHTFYVDSKKMLLVHNQCGPGSPGGQNVIMPDGSVRFISDSIDPRIPLPSYMKRPRTDVVVAPSMLAPNPTKFEEQTNPIVDFFAELWRSYSRNVPAIASRGLLPIDESEQNLLGTNIWAHYAIPFKPATRQYYSYSIADTGVLESKSSLWRHNFLIEYALKNGAQKDGKKYSFKFAQWTNVFAISKTELENRLGDFKILQGQETFQNSLIGFALTNTSNFSVIGEYVITFNEQTKMATLEMNLQWCWFDCIDANSFSEYNWESSKIWGGIEGLVDIFFDKLLRCSFNIAVFFDEVGTLEK